MARLAAEGDTADRLTVVPEVVVRGVDSVRIEAQVVGVGATTTDRGPVVAEVACGVQVVVWADPAALDKHQRRLHSTIVFALAEVWVMRLEKLPFDVVLLVGRAGFHRLYMARMLSRSVGFSWVNLRFRDKVVASCAARRIKRTPS